MASTSTAAKLPAPDAQLAKAFTTLVNADDVLRTFETYGYDGFTVLPYAKDTGATVKVRYNNIVMYHMPVGKNPKWIVPRLDFTANTCFNMLQLKAEYKNSNPKFAVATDATYKDNGREYQIGKALKVIVEVWEKFVAANKDTTYKNPFSTPTVHVALKKEKIITDMDGNVIDTKQYEIEHVCVEIPRFPPRNADDKPIADATKELIPVYDFNKPSQRVLIDNKNKKYSLPYELAQVDDGNGKMVNVNHDNVQEFITRGSLVMGDVTFSAVRSVQGYSLKISINNVVVKPAPGMSDDDCRKRYASRVDENTDAANVNFGEEKPDDGGSTQVTM